MPSSSRYPLLALGWLLAVCGASPVAANIVIDHAAIRAVDSYSQATMDAIAHASFYFEHASVGSNMVAGLNSLHDTNPTFYRLTTSEVGAAPTGPLAGTVYENPRGNPDWTVKISGFTSRINAGSGVQTTYALNKFCWIDENASWSEYATSLAALEAAHPGTTFAYMTMPLTPGTGWDNVLRNQFNTNLRNWAAANDRILFDVADIEAHNAAGVLQTFTFDGALYQRMADEWTDDGGHPNSNGSDALLARGFYVLAASSTIPEPATYAVLLGLGALGLVVWRRRTAARR